jgi:hypothetical protein
MHQLVALDHTQLYLRGRLYYYQTFEFQRLKGRFYEFA